MILDGQYAHISRGRPGVIYSNVEGNLSLPYLPQRFRLSLQTSLEEPSQVQHHVNVYAMIQEILKSLF